MFHQEWIWVFNRNIIPRRRIVIPGSQKLHVFIKVFRNMQFARRTVKSTDDQYLYNVKPRHPFCILPEPIGNVSIEIQFFKELVA